MRPAKLKDLKRLCTHPHIMSRSFETDLPLSLGHDKNPPPPPSPSLETPMTYPLFVAVQQLVTNQFKV